MQELSRDEGHRHAQLDGRNLHLVKKALAIAVLTIQRSPEGPFRSDSDMRDMKDLLDDIIASEVRDRARRGETASAASSVADEPGPKGDATPLLANAVYRASS